MVGYTAIENAVHDRLLSLFSGEVDTDTCKVSDIDGVVTAMFTSNKKYGCVIDYDGGSMSRNADMNAQMWTWSIAGVFLIRYSPTIEADLRYVVDKVRSIFDIEHARLGGLTPKAMIADLGKPEIGDINDTPFYWLPFVLDIIDK